MSYGSIKNDADLINRLPSKSGPDVHPWGGGTYPLPFSTRYLYAQKLDLPWRQTLEITYKAAGDKFLGRIREG